MEEQAVDDLLHVVVAVAAGGEDPALELLADPGKGKEKEGLHIWGDRTVWIRI